MRLHRMALAALFLAACAQSKPQVKAPAPAPVAQAPAPAPAPAPVTVTEASPAAVAAPALDPIHFDFDKAIIHSEDQTILVGIGGYMLKVLNVKVVIAGHCDERGTVEYNIALGDRRAWAARDYLVRLGIAPERIRTISYGEAKPVDSGHDETAWAKNRRAEFQIEEGQRAQK